MVYLESLQFLELEVLDRHLQHELAPHLCPGLHTQLELVKQDWHQVPADLQERQILSNCHNPVTLSQNKGNPNLDIKLDHVSAMLDCILH